MLHASSQVSHTFRRASDRSPSLECLSGNGSAKKERTKLACRVKSSDSPDHEDETDGNKKSKRRKEKALSDSPNNSQQTENLAASARTMPSNQRHLLVSDQSFADQDLHNEVMRLQQLQAKLQQQLQLRQVEHQLRSSLKLSAIFRAAVVESAKLFDAKQTVLMQYHAETQQWAQVAQYCHNQSVAWQKPCRLVQEESPDIARQLLSGELLEIFASQPLPTIETRQWLAHYPGNWLILPVFVTPLSASAQQRVTTGSAAGDPQQRLHWGALALALPEQPCAAWSSDMVASAQSIVSELACVIAQAEQYQTLLCTNQALQKLASSDGLTGLANRRRFDEHLADEWQRLARDRQPLSLILCDLDHFKHYNDTFGHPAGDRCLTKVANALKSGPRRPADLVARYGGEEFAVILPNTDTNGAWRIAQKLHHSIRSLRIAHAVDPEKPYVTVTMGVSTIIPGHAATAQVLVQAADLALYHAKKQGRDRTYVHAHYNTVDIDAQQTCEPGEETLKVMPPD